jgi:hypothetical protein
MRPSFETIVCTALAVVSIPCGLVGVWIAPTGKLFDGTVVEKLAVGSVFLLISLVWPGLATVGWITERDDVARRGFDVQVRSDNQK